MSFLELNSSDRLDLGPLNPESLVDLGPLNPESLAYVDVHKAA